MRTQQLVFSWASALAASALFLLCACGAITPQQTTKTALDVAKYACVVANEDLPVPKDKTLGEVVAAACGLDNTFGPIIEQLVGVDRASKAGAQSLAAQRCPK